MVKKMLNKGYNSVALISDISKLYNLTTEGINASIYGCEGLTLDGAFKMCEGLDVTISKKKWGYLVEKFQAE